MGKSVIKFKRLQANICHVFVGCTTRTTLVCFQNLDVTSIQNIRNIPIASLLLLIYGMYPQELAHIKHDLHPSTFKLVGLS